MSKKQKGRPQKAKDERRMNVLRIRLTEAERDLLDAAAAAAALDSSTWARMVLLKEAKAKAG